MVEMACEEDKFQVSINHEGETFTFIVNDLETAGLILNDHDVAYKFLHDYNPTKFPLPESTTKVDTKDEVTEVIWTRRKPTTIDLDATAFLLQLRQQYSAQFDDKKTNKSKLWHKIAEQLADNKFNVGENSAERCRQKFANLTKAYISYIKHQKRTGEEYNKDVPPFFDELHSILGMKHKVNPQHLEDSLDEPSEDANDNERETEVLELEESEPAPSTSTSSSEESTNRFKNVRKKLKPLTKGETVLQEWRADRQFREQQFMFVKERLTKAEEQRDRLLNILEKAFVKDKRGKRHLSASDSE